VSAPSWPEQRTEGYRSARGLAVAAWLSAVMFGALLGLVVFAWPASAAEPRTTFTASASELVVTYGAGADSIDVNVRYPDGTGFNHHPNRPAAVGEVLTLPLTGRPAWVQVHSTDCHIGEPGSPGYGTDCRLIEETPWTPDPTPSPQPTEPTTPPGPSPEPTEEPSPTPTGAPSPSTPAPSPSATSGPSPAPSAAPATDYLSEVSAVEERAATASPRELAATGTTPGWIAVGALSLIAIGAVFVAARKEHQR